jgi:hypothetical protein
MTSAASRITLRIVLGALIAGAAAPVVAIPPVTLEAHLVVRVDALMIEDDRSKSTGVTAQTEVGPSKTSSIDLRVPWSGATVAIDVRLTMRVKDVSTDAVTLVCSSVASPGDAGPVRAGRDFRFGDDGTSLFEVYGDGNGRLLLTIHAERVERPVARAAPTPGDAVRFGVAVEGVAGEQSMVLETNEMRSFVGQSVEYSFQFGPAEGRESLRLVLLPVSISGGMMTMEAKISGVLPSPGGPTLIDRTDRIVVSRGATTFVQATVGTPPSGYRFQVTPDF